MTAITRDSGDPGLLRACLMAACAVQRLGFRRRKIVHQIAPELWRGTGPAWKNAKHFRRSIILVPEKPQAVRIAFHVEQACIRQAKALVLPAKIHVARGE